MLNAGPGLVVERFGAWEPRRDAFLFRRLLACASSCSDAWIMCRLRSECACKKMRRFSNRHHAIRVDLGPIEEERRGRVLGGLRIGLCKRQANGRSPKSVTKSDQCANLPPKASKSFSKSIVPSLPFNVTPAFKLSGTPGNNLSSKYRRASSLEQSPMLMILQCCITFN